MFNLTTIICGLLSIAMITGGFTLILILMDLIEFHSERSIETDDSKESLVKDGRGVGYISQVDFDAHNVEDVGSNPTPTTGLDSMNGKRATCASPMSEPLPETVFSPF